MKKDDSAITMLFILGLIWVLLMGRALVMWNLTDPCASKVYGPGPMICMGVIGIIMILVGFSAYALGKGQ